MRLFMTLAACLALAWLTGCTAVGGISGGVAAIATGTATGNPAAGVAVGIGVRAAVNSTLKSYSRNLSNDEQMHIAQTIGDMQLGETRLWESKHFIPFSSSSGDVTLVRAFDTPLAPCREALFRVAKGNDKTPGTQAFVITACEGGDGWKWSVAEPAVPRWGALQ